MMFWKKNSKIHLDCITPIPTAASDNPIDKASNFIPSWWKNLPISYADTNELGVEYPRATMKGCLGFIDLYASGLILPLWSDLNIKVENDSYVYQYAAKTGVLDHHPPVQYNNTFKGQVHFKIVAPWLLSEKTGVRFLLTGCTWATLEKTPKITIVSGVVNFDVNQACNVNAFISLDNQPYQYNLKAGMPLMHIIPLSEKELVTHIHVVDSAEWDKINLKSKPYKFVQWGIHKRRLKNKSI